MNKRIIIYLVFSILCMVLIFTFSSNVSKKSNGLSKGLINNCVIIYEKITGNDINNKKIVEELNYPVRKVAHYTIYLLLGFFVYSIFIHTDIRYKEIFTILICFIYAVSDELHQLFVNGRTGQVIDVFIDTLGTVTIVFIYKYIYSKKEKFYNNLH